MAFICGRSNPNNQTKLLTIPLDGAEPKETEKAHGIVVNGQTIWIPKSQIQEFKQENGAVSFWCPMWLITEKSLEFFIDTSFEPSLFG